MAQATIMQARLIDAYNEGWNNARKQRQSQFYGFGYLPETIETEYSRGYAAGLQDAA